MVAVKDNRMDMKTAGAMFHRRTKAGNQRRAAAEKKLAEND